MYFAFKVKLPKLIIIIDFDGSLPSSKQVKTNFLIRGKANLHDKGLVLINTHL